MRYSVKDLTAQLLAVGLEAPQAEFEVLTMLAAVLGKPLSQIRLDLLAGGARGVGSGSESDSASESVSTPGIDLTAAQASQVQQMLIRRAQHEPLQYILGTAPFRFLELAVGPGVFIPRPETELLVDACEGFLKSEGSHQAGLPTDSAAPSVEAPVIVDLCAGSGAIGLSLMTELTVGGSTGAGLQQSMHVSNTDSADFPEVFAVEKSQTALRYLLKNAAHLLTPAQAQHFHPFLADALAADTLSQLNGRVDIVVSNPPYIPESQPVAQPEAAQDPDLALYGGSADGLEIPEGVVRTAKRLLRPAGFLALEHDISQSRSLAEYCEKEGFVGVEAHQDLTGRPRYVTARLGQ